MILHNPMYAGAFTFGRTRTYKRADGKTHVERLPREEWHTLIPSAHPGYISWEEYERNQQLLRANSQAYGGDRRAGPPREGPALLQGIAVCGVCGNRITVRYHERKQGLVPDYVCSDESVHKGGRVCQRIAGSQLEEAIGRVLVEVVTPLALEVSLAVQDELNTRLEEADRLRRQQVERVRYEAELAQRRYMRVDPENRLVADVLEAEWNSKLRILRDAQQELEVHRQSDQKALDEQQRAVIRQLASDFPRV